MSPLRCLSNHHSVFLWQQHESLFLPCSQVPAMKSGHTLLVLATFPSTCPTKTSCSSPSIPAGTTRFRLHIATAAFRICQLLVPCTAPSRRVTSPMAAMLPSGWVSRLGFRVVLSPGLTPRRASCSAWLFPAIQVRTASKAFGSKAPTLLKASAGRATARSAVAPSIGSTPPVKPGLC